METRHETTSSRRDVRGSGAPGSPPLPPPVAAAFETLALGTSLVDGRALTRARTHARQQALSVPDAILALGLAPEVDTGVLLARAARVPLLDLDEAEISALALRLVPERVGRRHLILPLIEDGRQLTYACIHPFDDDAERDVAFASGRQTRFVLALRSQITRALDRYYPKMGDVERLVGRIRSELRIAPIENTATPKGSPVVRLCDQILSSAVTGKTSDVHFEPHKSGVIVRFRVHGILETVMSLPLEATQLLTNRFKVMAKLDISQRQRPQDGSFRITLVDREIDVRLSSLPTINGEKLVMRLIDSSTEPLKLPDLRYDPASEKRFEQALKRPDGLVLVTGPTGCGKTTALYAALHYLCDGHTNIVTVEDPVERRVKRVTQIAVNNSAGTTFATVLRSVLRQDPNVTMVGEIRDAEVAAIVGQAAYTGHLVLSSLHTIDTATAITRLINLGLEPFKVAESLNAIVAQRLLRRLCPRCRRTQGESTTAASVVGPGCVRCRQTGYVDRVAVAEVLVPTDTIRDVILAGSSAHAIRHAMQAAGLRTMRETALELVEQGITSLDEVDRVLGDGENTIESPVAETRERPRVLIADDDRMIRMLVRMLLEKEGYEVVEAPNGRHAVEIAQGERPDLIIMDLTMPEMDGYQAVELIRADLALATVPLIVLTSEVGPGVEQRVLDLAADDYLTRPFEQPVLVARVRAAFRRAVRLAA